MHGAESSGQATIVSLLQAEWQSFWTSGGRWTRFPSSPRHCYVAPSLIQTSDGLFEVGARTLESKGVEHFALWFRAALAAGKHNSKAMFVPERLAVTTSPEDLGIENFKSAHGRCCLLVVDRTAETTNARLHGLIVSTESGDLMFFVDEDVPESALVTTDAAVVEHVCVGRELVKLPLSH